MANFKNIILVVFIFFAASFVCADSHDYMLGQTKGGYFQHNKGQTLDDSTITTIISTKFAKDREIAPFNINIATNNGVVNLAGEVKTDAQFDRVVTIAESVQGIQDVNTSNLSVKGSRQPVSDSIITAKIKGEIIRNKILTSHDAKYWSVHVKTKNGVVYLSGSVNNQAQKTNIVNIAKSVSGVISVDDSDLMIASSNN